MAALHTAATSAATAAAHVDARPPATDETRPSELWYNEHMKNKVTQGDITTLAMDAIVDLTNQVMLGGGGVDGVIHCAAGCGLCEVCLNLNGGVE